MHASLELLYGWIERKVVNTGDRAELLDRVSSVHRYVDELEESWMWEPFCPLCGAKKDVVLGVDGEHEGYARCRCHQK